MAEAQDEFLVIEDGDLGNNILEKVAASRKEDRWPILVISREPRLKKSKKYNRDPVAVERSNLVSLIKLVIKELIESSLMFGRMLDGDFIPLHHFFLLLEHAMRHGLKPKKGLLGPKKELWNVLEQVDKTMPEAADITSSVRDLPRVKTPLGRTRAWLRLALMQKKLPDYFKSLIDKREALLKEFYEDDALMRSEEAIVIGGLLVGLNVIDCNLCVKEEELDYRQDVIDFSLYLRGDTSIYDEPTDPGENNATMTAVLDQKNYIEELNRHLNATVTDLQQKVEQLQLSNLSLKEDLIVSKNQNLTLQEEMEKLRVRVKVGANLSSGDHDETSSAKGLSQNEKAKILELEKELDSQISMKSEALMAMKLLEKDIHEKQDTVISLRRQLEDIKQINLQLYNKLQECESSLKSKSENLNQVEKTSSHTASTLQQLEAKLVAEEKKKAASEATIIKLSQNLSDREQKQSSLESDLKIEHEWRLSLQSSVTEMQDELESLRNEMERLNVSQDEYQLLKTDHSLLQRKCIEYEQALEEIGIQLSESKLQVEDMKESTRNLKEAVWTDDKDAPCCRQCEKPFSVARRKHHCRNCGEIFCHSCSDNTMPLPSSAKPVRVCDNCQAVLLQRYTAT